MSSIQRTSTIGMVIYGLYDVKVTLKVKLKVKCTLDVIQNVSHYTYYAETIIDLSS